MNKFSVKNINFVGAGAAVLAFIFAFIPFYKLKPTSYLLQNDSTAALYSISKNLVTYNFFGVLCLILSIAAVALYVLNFSQKITIAAIAVSVLDLISLFLALIVGNSDIKSTKDLINTVMQYTGLSGSTGVLLKSSVAAGFVLELIVIIIMVGSYWINELVVKPYILGDKSGAKLNPLEGLTGTAKAQAQQQFGQPQQYAQAPQQQFGQPQQYAQAPQQQFGQPQQYAQAPQQQFGQAQQYAQAPQQPVQPQQNDAQ